MKKKLFKAAGLLKQNLIRELKIKKNMIGMMVLSKKYSITMKSR